MEKPLWIKTYIVDFLPFFSIFLYILAIVYHIALFSVFDIDITYFISLSEMLLSIVEPLIILSLAIFILWATYIYFNTYVIPGTKYYREKVLSKKHIFKILNKKFKNTKFYQYFFKENIEQRKMKKKKGKALKIYNSYYKKYDFEFSALALSVLSFIIFKYGLSKDTELIEAGMGYTVMGMLFPILIIFEILLICLIPSFFFDIKGFKIKPSNIKSGVVIFYLYSLFLFYFSGIETGHHIKENNNVHFTISITDGETYDNKKYTYIQHINGKAFLLENESNNIVMLNDDNILSMKIDFGKTQKTIIKFMIEYISQIVTGEKQKKRIEELRKKEQRDKELELITKEKSKRKAKIQREKARKEWEERPQIINTPMCNDNKKQEIWQTKD